VLLGDETSGAEILKGNDREARLALLAGARLVHHRLPLESVILLLPQTDSLLKSAAERYLELEDSLEAQEALRIHRADEFLITGALDHFNPVSKPNDGRIAWENSLLKELKVQDGPEEIFAKYSFFGPFLFSASTVVRIYKGKGELCKQNDKARIECRNLSSFELESLRSIFDAVSFDELPALILPGFEVMGDAGEFIRLNKKGGRRVLTSDLNYLPDYSPFNSPKPHLQLERVFNQLKNTGEYELRYKLKEKLGGVEVLVADDNLHVSHVCMQGNDVRVLVSGKTSGDDEIWFAVSDGQIGRPVKEPDACRILEDNSDLPEDMARGGSDAETIWQAKPGQDVFRIGEWKGREGIWRCRKDRAPVLFGKELTSV
jgi:hypothetical protein